MNAVTTISTGFEQSLSVNKDTQMTGNKNNINAPGIQFQDFFYALLHYAAFTLVKKKVKSPFSHTTA